MSTLEIVFALCKERGVAISKVERDLKFGNGYFKSLKKGTIPSDRAAKIADYFGVSNDFLLGITPDSYLMVTRYQLAEAKKNYAKATDEKTRDELAYAIDVLTESLDDQLLAMQLMGAQKAHKSENTELLQNLRDEEKALLAVTKGMTAEQIKKMTEFASLMKGNNN